jgi:hypothetical protein
VDTDDVQPYAEEPAEPGMDGGLDPIEPVDPVATPGGKRIVLAILAALVVGAIGVAVWGILYATFKREYVGIAVVIGLLVGYVVREVSGRSTIGVRLLASLLTAVACVAGTVVGETAYTAKVYGLPFWDLIDRATKDTWALLQDRTLLQFGVYAAALVIAFLAAGPKKETPKKGAPDPFVGEGSESDVSDPGVSDPGVSDPGVTSE